MSISGFTPTAAMPTLATSGMLAGSNPLIAAQPGAGHPGGSALLGAQVGVTEKPGILTRFSNAMKAAIGELRGSTGGQLQTQQLALSLPSSAPVTVDRPAGAPRTGTKAKGRTFTDKQGNLRQVGTGTVLKPAAGAAAAGPAGVAPQPQPQLQQQPQLPMNAAQVPGATVYSYDQHGNPVAPTMQQLGMTPTMLQGLEGMTRAVNPDGPQVNATNQTNVGAGPGLGLGAGVGIGTGVPVLGQPIAVAPVAPLAPAAPRGTGSGTQAVTNSNTTDVASRNEGFGGYGYGGVGGFGGSPWDGIATPAAPYGPSMTGAYVHGDRSRLI